MYSNRYLYLVTSHIKSKFLCAVYVFECCQLPARITKKGDSRHPWPQSSLQGPLWTILQVTASYLFLQHILTPNTSNTAAWSAPLCDYASFSIISGLFLTKCFDVPPVMQYTEWQRDLSFANPKHKLKAPGAADLIYSRCGHLAPRVQGCPALFHPLRQQCTAGYTFQLCPNALINSWVSLNQSESHL